MKTQHITTYRILQEEIRTLKEETKEQEELISKQAGELYNKVLNPAPIIKNTIHTLAKDTEVKSDLLKIGIHYAGDFLVDTLIQKKGSTVLAGLLDKLQLKAGNGKIGGLIGHLAKFLKGSEHSEEKENSEEEGNTH